MKNKGFTVVELLAAFSFTMLISIFLFEILIEAKDVYVETALKTNVQTKASIVSKNIRNTMDREIIGDIICSDTQCTVDGTEYIKINHVASTNQPDSIKIGAQVITMPKDGTQYMKITNAKLEIDGNTILKLHFELTSPNLSKPYVYNAAYTIKNNSVS